MTKVLTTLLTIFLSSNSYAATNHSPQPFQKLFEQWTQGFNQKNLATSCGLFSTALSANYQGIPPKNYTNVCNGFKKIFQEKNRDYHYHFKINDVYQTQQLAAVRITWYLDIYENKKLISTIQDEGLDVLEQDMNGTWRIINYLAYPVQQQS